MNQKFSRKELERLGCNEEEIKLVIECQRKLPIIFDNDEVAKFCVNARILWTQLESKRQFSDWISQKFKKCKVTENVDYIPFSQKCEKPNGGRPSDEFVLSMRISQHFCMLQNNEIGFKMRDYFILMEDLVKRNKEWLTTRYNERKNYIPMCKAFSESMYRICGRYGDDSDFSFEANRLNIIATGEKAQSIKNYLGIGVNELTRDRLLNDYNEKIDFLQEQNILLFSMDLPIIQRLNMLIKFFDTKYPNAKPIKQYKNRDYLLDERNKMLNELTN